MNEYFLSAKYSVYLVRNNFYILVTFHLSFIAAVAAAAAVTAALDYEDKHNDTVVSAMRTVMMSKS